MSQPPASLLFHLFICVSVVLSLLFSIYPLSPELSSLRPELLCLLLIYWTSNKPQHIGMMYAWGAGLLQDIVEGSVWGAHGMALAIVAYICIVSHQRIKNYSVWHQSIWVFVLVGVHQVVINWMQGLEGYNSPPLYLVLSTVISALCWPLISIGIGQIRVLYRIH